MMLTIDVIAQDPMVPFETLFNEEPKNIAERYRDLINAFDGSDDAWLLAGLTFEELHSRNLVTILGNRDEDKRDYEWFKAFLKRFADNRNISRVREIELIDNGRGIRAVVQNIIGGVDQGVTEQFGYVETDEEGLERVVLWGATLSDETRWRKMIDTVQKMQTSNYGMTLFNIY